MSKYHIIGDGLVRGTGDNVEYNFNEQARTFIFSNDSTEQIKITLEDAVGNTQEHNFNPAEYFNMGERVTHTLAFTKLTVTASSSVNFRVGALVEVK